MKKILLISIFILIILPAFSQEVESLKIHDTRNVNDQPNFVSKLLRVDFKFRNIISVPGQGTYSTSITIAPWNHYSGDLHHQLNFNNGGIYYRTGSLQNSSWNEWKQLMIVNADGSISGKLEVNGTIRSKEVKIEATGWPDFVFDKGYKLPSLKEIETHINEKGTLPNIPSEKDVKENGIDVGEMQAKLLQKIEELTLYVIEQDKQIKELKEQLNKK